MSQNEQPLLPVLEKRKDENKLIREMTDFYIAKRELGLKETFLESCNEARTPSKEADEILSTQNMKIFFKKQAKKDVEKNLRKEQKDKLTNLLKKEHLPFRYELESIYYPESKKENLKIAMVFFDVDNFKMINDEGKDGHTTGDEVLRNIGYTLKGEPEKGSDNTSTTEGIMDSNDTAFRAGGDEFVLIAKKPQEELENEIKKIHDKLTKITYEDNQGVTHNIGISMGAVIIIPNSDNSLPDYSNIYEKSDAIMYNVKKDGKNQVKIYNSDQEIEINSPSA